jgi:hypothetical protein
MMANTVNLLDANIVVILEYVANVDIHAKKRVDNSNQLQKHFFFFLFRALNKVICFDMSLFDSH